MTARKWVGFGLLFILAVWILGAVWLFVMPIGSTNAATSGPLDTACMSHLKATTNLDYSERKAKCLIRLKASVVYSIAAGGDPHKTLTWWVGNEMVKTQAIFEVEKQHRPYPWSPRRWVVVGKTCWVVRAIIYSADITTCAGRRGDGKLHTDMTFTASWKVFDWIIGGFLSRSIHSWKTVHDDDDTVTPANGAYVEG